MIENSNPNYDVLTSFADEWVNMDSDEKIQYVLMSEDLELMRILLISQIRIEEKLIEMIFWFVFSFSVFKHSFNCSFGNKFGGFE